MRRICVPRRRSTWRALRANVAALRAKAPGAAFMAVVKADAYGHGMVPCARAALEGGATWLGVATPEEALALRAAGVGGRVLCWLWTPGGPWRECVEADVDVTVSAHWALERGAGRGTGRGPHRARPAQDRRRASAATACSPPTGPR